MFAPYDPFRRQELSATISPHFWSKKSKNTPKWFFYTALQLNILEKNWEEVNISIKNINKYTNANTTSLKLIKSRIFLYKAIEEYNNKAKNIQIFNL